MTYLLHIDWTPIHPALKGFAENRIKRFLHVQVQYGIGDTKGHNWFEFLHWVGFPRCPFQIYWCIGHCKCQPFKVAFRSEYVHRQADVENTLPGKKVFSNLGQNKFQHSLLLIDFLLVDEYNTAARLIGDPLPLPNWVPVDGFLHYHRWGWLCNHQVLMLQVILRDSHQTLLIEWVLDFHMRL